MSLTQNRVNKSFTKAFRDSFSRGQKQELKDYQLRQLPIGEGTFGKVMLGIHLGTQEKVAIKILEKEKIEDEGDRQRILREIQILKLLKHPNIVQLYEIFEDEKRLYLIMEYAENGELFDYIVSKGKIKEVEACKFYQQLVDGIEYIHKLNIVHRDLKPENLLLDDRMNIKLVDFGLSNLYKNEQKLQTACGSPCYAPPEMIKGLKYQGLPADIWSSGVILFALICGYLPFDDNDTQILYQKIISGDYSVPACISPEASDLLRKVLTVDPDKRYTIQQIKSHPWFNINKTYVSNPKGLIFGYHQIPLDKFLVDQVIKIGFEKESVIQSIINNRHNKATTMYYLLLKKFIKNGHVSCADIQSICFKPKLLQKKKQESKKDWDQEVKYILDKHHQKIQKKMSRKGKKMNDTSLKSYEQNIRKSTQGDSSMYKKMKKQSLFNTTIKSKKKQRNRTVNIGQKEIFGSQRTNYSVSKEKKSNSKQKKSRKGRQNIYLINHQKLHKVNKENSNSKRKKKTSLFMTKKSNGRNSRIQKISMKQKKEETYDDMNTHKGPLNLSSTTMKDPLQIFMNIKNIFKKLGVNCESSQRFKGVFKYKNLKCQLEIQKVDQIEKMYIIKFFRLNSEKKKFFEISSKLFQEIEFQLIINYSLRKQNTYSNRIVNYENVSQSNYKELDLSDVGIKNFHEDVKQWSKIPQLEFDFQEMVEHQGIYKLSDLKNFYSKEDFQFLQNIPQPKELKMELIQNYTPPSKDSKLKQFTIDNKCNYMMSTSTISSFLSQMFYSIAGFKSANYTSVPYHQSYDKKKFMNMQKKPSTNFFRCIDDKNDIWALDSDKGVFKQDHQILMDMGKILELQYTLKTKQFQKLYNKNSSYQFQQTDQQSDYHRLTIINNEICMRSQIDCWQEMKDGSKIVYEIKTRALAPIRYDVINYKNYLDYSLKNLMGSIYSYERENYDLIRGAILKYYFQLKIGGMDGAFIGYHNTKQNFGFEYIKRTEIEKILFSSPFKGEIVFLIGSKMINIILDYVKDFFKNFSYDFLKIGYYATSKGITVFVETFKDEDYEKLQSLEYEKTDDFREVNFYYDKFKPNPEVYKFIFDFEYYINGYKNNCLLYNLCPEDHINIKYKAIDFGRANYSEYMNFLLHAYKTSQLIFNKQYVGRHIIFKDTITDFT